MVQPQLGLSAGGPSTLGSLRIKMRIRGLLLPSLITHGQKEIDPGRPNTQFKWLSARAIQIQ
jgi:hypothetical protein